VVKHYAALADALARTYAAHPGRRMRDVLTLAAIDYAGSIGVDANVQIIAELTGQSESTIRRALEALRAANLASMSTPATGREWTTPRRIVVNTASKGIRE
jgi:hypothetical protein